MEVVRSHGLEIAYERVGEGPPLVFVHGAAEDGRVWQPQFAALGSGFTVVAWDEPGAGRSSDVPAESVAAMITPAGDAARAGLASALNPAEEAEQLPASKRLPGII